jgi:tRNA 5-methylaminomethyl-2-thiouridine biosynthesis bifunctional protein
MSKDRTSPHEGAIYCLDAPVVSRRDTVLRSDDFDDLYFDAHDGLAESQYVFINGTNLREKLRNSKHLTIAETGFGTGLNFLAVLDLLVEFPNHQVDYISYESRPLSPDVIATAHAAFPSLCDHSADLLGNLPPRWPGVHLRHFKDGQVRLHLYYGIAEDSLAASDFHADIWFLDGFAPAKNPQMWSQKVLLHVGRLTRAGGRLTSFTAAGAVRNGLNAAGFSIKKRPGFGRKRDMIIGVKMGTVSVLNRKGAVGIIGGGVAGVSVAAGLRHRGIEATILDAGPGLATAASGNRLALQTPRLTIDHNDASQLSASCLAYAAHCSDAAGATLSDKVVSLDWPDREAVRQNKFRSQSWPCDLLRPVDVDTAAHEAGIPLPVGGVVHDFGRVIEPARLCQHLAGPTPVVIDTEIINITRQDQGLVLLAKNGRQFNYEQIVVATGAGLPESFRQLAIAGVTVDIIAGQVSHIPQQAALAPLVAGLSFGGYFTPCHNGFHELGATFDRSGQDINDADAFCQNRNLLPPALKDLLQHLRDCPGRTSQRASTPDHNPIVGQLSKDIFVLGAVGARGFTLAPLLGEYLAAQIALMPNCLGRSIQAALDPFRFRLRRGLKA